ncbi:MAG: hypothetical protein WCF67_19805, partial [Chitinophagaceae bacterium]
QMTNDLVTNNPFLFKIYIMIEPQPSFDDVKRFARKVYGVCVIGMILGIFLLSLLLDKTSVLASIGRIGCYALIVLSILMLGFFIRFFNKLKTKMQDPFWNANDGLDGPSAASDVRDQDNQK